MKKTQWYKGHRWTDAELTNLVADWCSGMAIEEIASKFGMTCRGINTQITRMRRNGIPVPRRINGHKAGRSNQPWTQEEIEYLVRRRAERATVEQIGSELDRTFLAVQGMVRTLIREGVQIPMFGSGVRRLWDPQKVSEAIIGRGLVPEEKRGRKSIMRLVRGN